MSVSEKRTRELMQARGIRSISELAERASVNRSHIYALWKDGETSSIGLARRLSRALGVTIAQFVGDSPPSPPTPYDTNPHYRTHIANLEAIDPSDREAILVLVEKYAAAVGKAPAPAKSRRPFTREPKTAETTERKRPTDERNRPITAR